MRGECSQHLPRGRVDHNNHARHHDGVKKIDFFRITGCSGLNKDTC